MFLGRPLITNTGRVGSATPSWRMRVSKPPMVTATFGTARRFSSLRTLMTSSERLASFCWEGKVAVADTE
jgi:hypothetical protein